MSIKDEQKKTDTVFSRISSDENNELIFIANKYRTTKTAVIRTAIKEFLERNNQHPQSLKKQITVNLEKLLIAIGLETEYIDKLVEIYKKDNEQ